MAYRKVREGDTQVVAILRVERGVVDQIDAAADHVAGSEGRPVRLTCAGRAKAVAVIAVVTIRVLVPSWQPIHVDTVCREPNAHVPITSLAHNLYLEVVQAAGCWYGVCCANTGSVFVSFTVTWEKRRRKRRLKPRCELICGLSEIPPSDDRLIKQRPISLLYAYTNRYETVFTSRVETR